MSGIVAGDFITAARSTCGPLDVCYCTPRCVGAGSGLPKPKYPSANKLIATLRREGTSTHHVEDTVGFLGREGFSYSQTGPINPDGPDAAWLIERLLLYVAHDVGCGGNEFDPLDDTPCTCGLRNLLRGKVERPALAKAGPA